MEESNEQSVNPFAFATLFSHFEFTKDEKQDKYRVKTLEEVWNMSSKLAEKYNTTPIHEITVIERRIGNQFEQDKLTSVHRFLTLLSSMGDTVDELRAMEE